MEITKKIFGKNYTFIYDDSHSSIIEPAIELYPNGNNKESDVTIHLKEKWKNEDVLAQNPSEFKKLKNGIDTIFYRGNILWKKIENKLTVHLYVTRKKTTLKELLKNLISMEYATETEDFVQILHENVLVPSVYFFKDLSIIHAAVFSIHGKAVMLAGTGGVGKTSASLSLRNNKDIAFVADDISVLSADGNVYANLAWPKVYGYNLSSYITKKELLKGRSLANKFHFNLKLKWDAKQVRRKMKPNVLYQNHVNDFVPLDKVFYLFRDHSTEMHTSPLAKTDAIQMGLHVMKTEYNDKFHNYSDLDQYNSIALGIEPLVKTNIVFTNWENNLTQTFENKAIQLLHIPIDMEHQDYLKNIHQFLLEQK